MDGTAIDGFVRSMEAIVSAINATEAFMSSWAFLDIALGFLVKGSEGDGLDQLLCHITAIEACVGEKKDGLTRLLSERVCRIIGRNAEEAIKVRKAFKELYEFRSALVHGRTELSMERPKDRVNLEHLRKARDFSRQVVLWTLFHLAHLSKTTNNEPPSRDEILTSHPVYPDLIPMSVGAPALSVPRAWGKIG